MTQKEFWREFLQPSPINILIWLLSFIVLSVIGEYIPILIMQPENLTIRSHVSVIISVLIGILVGYILFNRRQKIMFRWKEGELSPRYKALVVILSTPGIIETLLGHHGSKLEHIWIITNFRHEAYTDFIQKDLSRMRDKLALQFKDHIINFDDDITSNAQETYSSTIKSVNDAIEKYSIIPNEIIIDITGGTKEMTAGVILACSSNNWPMCYVRSEYTWDDAQKKNNRIEGSEKVLKFDISFIDSR